jgi:hypothetical protein
MGELSIGTKGLWYKKKIESRIKKALGGFEDCCFYFHSGTLSSESTLNTASAGFSSRIQSLISPEFL